MSNELLKKYLDLIDQAEKESAQKVDSKSPKDDKDKSVSEFVKKFNIRAGTKRIHNFIVFFYYRQKFQYAPKLNKISFFKEFSKLFPKARVGSQRYYLIDEGVFEMTREVRTEAKYYEQEYNSKSLGHRTRKENKKYEKKSKKEKLEKQDESTGTKANYES